MIFNHIKYKSQNNNIEITANMLVVYGGGYRTQSNI